MNLQRKTTAHKIWPLTLTIFLLTSVSISVYGDWTDDFSTSSLDDWSVWAEDIIEDPIKEVDPSWKIKDNELISDGAFKFGEYNHACKSINLGFGNWTFDYFWPVVSQTLILSQVFLGVRNDFRGISGAITITGIEFNLGNGGGGVAMDHVSLFVYDNNEISLKSNITYFSSNIDEGWQNYRIERTDRIVVYLDGEELITLPGFTSELPQLNEFCLASMIGSKARFDNIEASADVNLTTDETTPIQFIYFLVPLIFLTKFINRIRRNEE